MFITNAINLSKAFILACRPKTLGAMFCPVFIGLCFAYKEQRFSWFYAFCTLICSLLLQVLANLANDYGDFLKKADTNERLGPIRVMQMNIISPNTMIFFITITLLICLTLGLIISLKSGWVIVLIGLISVIIALGYTLGPFALAYFGFCEVIVWFIFGPISALGTYYVQTDSLSLQVFLASLSSGFLASALLLTNNLRDIKEDKKNHKKTIAVRYEENFCRKLLLALLGLSFLTPILLSYYNKNLLFLLSGLVLLIPFKNIKMILHEKVSKNFNNLLADIGKTLYLFALFLGLIIIYA